MTASYDGSLRSILRTKSLEACCRPMDETIMQGFVYQTTKGTLAIRFGPKAKGTIIQCCPYCGASVEVMQ